ncbi:major head protein [Klebsiella phage MEW1]|uniref:Major capsid protein n=1 Tax=Klebsiella phage MEW1 TaxID=2776813 RepID=A0A7M1IDS0_9CAUD|nr:major head protein [Klebsiella phage MEW1]QOQ37724.1 major capsid protein [Klebsiella phage MEW1]
MDKLNSVVLDAQTIAGNPWVKQYLDGQNAINVPAEFRDADGGIAFYISQLAQIEQTIYATPYADITYLQDIPIVSGIPEHANHWVYRSYDGRGMGAFIGANASDLPRVAQSAKPHTVPLNYGGIECHYSLDELRTTASQNMPIDTMQQQLAYRAYEEHSQKVAYFGDSQLGMSGLLNHPNVTVTKASVDYTTATGQELFNMLNDPLFDIIKLSKNYHTPNTVRVFPDLWKRMNSELMTGYSDTTVMEFFKTNNAYTLMTGQEIDIQVRFQLTAAELAAGGVNNNQKDRVLIYEKNDRNLGVAKPIPFRMLAPQNKGLAVSVPAEYKISGTEIRYPLSAIYLDMK